MEEIQDIPVTAMLPQEEAFIFGGYHSIITGIDRQWEYGGFTLPDGTFWRYREPEAVVIVAGDHLRVSVQPITRSNDQVQMLDNPKNMFFSTRNFVMPDDEAISFAWEMRARCTGTKPHDLYDGFVSAHPLDFSTGIAFDFFVCNDMIAAVYALHPYPAMPLPPDPQDTTKPKYFTHFNELAVETAPWQGKSISVHGQGLTGEWGPFTITMRKDRA